MITVRTPTSGADIKVNANGEICATGTAVGDKLENPIEVKAKVYQGGPPDPLPASPPAGSTAAVVAGKNWTINPIGGAASAGAAPYPQNTIVIWVKFQAGTDWQEVTSVSFYGKASAGTECD